MLWLLAPLLCLHLRCLFVVLFSPLAAVSAPPKPSHKVFRANGNSKNRIRGLRLPYSHKIYLRRSMRLRKHLKVQQWNHCLNPARGRRVYYIGRSMVWCNLFPRGVCLSQQPAVASFGSLDLLTCDFFQGFSSSGHRGRGLQPRFTRPQLFVGWSAPQLNYNYIHLWRWRS